MAKIIRYKGERYVKVDNANLEKELESLKRQLKNSYKTFSFVVPMDFDGVEVDVAKAKKEISELLELSKTNFKNAENDVKVLTKMLSLCK